MSPYTKVDAHREDRLLQLGRDTILNIIETIDHYNEELAFRWETFSKRLLAAIQKSSVFVDCGAEFGFYTYLALRRSPACKIIAFEPEPVRFRLLDEFFGTHTKATFYPYALSDHAGTINLYKPNDNASCTVDKNLSQYDNLQMDADAIVQTVTLDEVMGDMPIDVIKMDIEGAEVLALAGMTRILRIQRPQIFMEVHPKYIESIQRDGQHFMLGKLQDAGYIIVGKAGPTQSLSGRVILVPEERQNELNYQ
jgi:FkbM family methyltransferase